MSEAHDDRLLRRFERERSARLQAEAIAESQLRESYEQQRDLDVVARVATLANESTDVRDTFQAVLPLLVERGGWMTGHVLTPTTDDPTAVASAGIWSHTNPTFGEKVQAASAGRRFRSGEGLAGTAYREGPTWEPDFAGSTTFLLRDELPMGSACAFPVMVASDVVAVFEFLTPVPRPADERFLALCRLIGAGLGRAVERSRSAAAEAAARQALENAVEERTRDLVDARQSAQATARARQNFHAALSHELGTPLHALTSALDAAQSTDGDELAALLAVAQRSAGELQDRSAQLLRNADSGLGDEPPRIVSLAKALEPSFDAYRRILGDAPRRLDVAVDATAETPVLLDEGAMVRGTEAVLTTAMLAADEGDIEVVLSTSATHATVRTLFTGGGVGVPELAQLAAESADGETTSDTAGDHTTISLSLPCVLPDTFRTGTTDRVLLVDDTAVMRRLCSAMVESLGPTVDVVNNGAEAIAAMSEQDYGLVLMDLSMPVLDGLAATRLIRSGRSGPVAATTPVVALTAHTSSTHLLRSRLAGMDDLLSKPFSKDQLARVLERFLPAD